MAFLTPRLTSWIFCPAVIFAKSMTISYRSAMPTVICGDGLRWAMSPPSVAMTWNGWPLLSLSR